MAIKYSLIFVCFTCICKIEAQCCGEGGEYSFCHDIPNVITTSSGCAVDSLVTTLTAGPCGPVVMQDFNMMDVLSHFTREKIAARVGHAKGAGAFGYFEVTKSDFSKYCKAVLFEYVGKRTDLFLRFSTAVQEIGTCDTVRALRGCAIKFYTKEGNFDMVGNNIPIFAHRHPNMISSVFHAQKPHPCSYTTNQTMFWDFMTLRPETCYQLMMTFSDRGIPDGYRHMNMHGSHTFKVVNNKREAFYCKFHFRTDQCIKNLNSSYAAYLCASDPNYSRRDLYTNIEAGNFPSWTMYYQIMTFKQAETCKFNPFDLTKVWPQGDYPYHEIGKLFLDRNPNNFFAEVEQCAFAPGHLIPGIEPSPDPMFQARMFSYSDTQRHRLGVNYQQLPINLPIAKVHNFNRDGLMCMYNQDNQSNYYPNSFDGDNVCPGAAISEWFVTGDVHRVVDNEDNYSQPGAFYRCVLNEAQKEEFIDNLVTSLQKVNVDLQTRAVEMFSRVDKGLCRRLNSKLGHGWTKGLTCPPEQRQQHVVTHPSKGPYPTLLDFGDLTRTGLLNEVWPLAEQ